MKHILAAVAAVATLTSTAYAADLGGSFKDGPMDSPVAGTSVRWSGFYVGIEGGYGVGNAGVNYSTDYSDNTSTVFSDKGQALSGLIGNLTAGVDYHFPASRWVAGAFGDYTFGKIDGSASYTGSIYNPSHYSSLGLSIENQFNIGGRLGFIVTPGTMAYAKLGWSHADINVSHTNIGAESQYTNPSPSGILAGAGFESNLYGGLFLRGEYDYVNYGKSTVYADTYAQGDFTVNEKVVVDVDEHLVKLGLVYKFGMGQ